MKSGDGCVTTPGQPRNFGRNTPPGRRRDQPGLQNGGLKKQIIGFRQIHFVGYLLQSGLQVSLSASSTTPAGFPVNGLRVKRLPVLFGCCSSV